MSDGARRFESDRAEAQVGVELPERRSELLGVYDRIRARVLSYVERRGSRLGRRLAETLLVVPDVLLLLIRLVLDPSVPRETRAVVGGGLAYFLLPLDVVPELLVGPPGYLEDLLVASTVLAFAFGDDLERYAERYWSGSDHLRRVLGDIADSTSRLLGTDIERRVEAVVSRLLRRRDAGSPGAS